MNDTHTASISSSSQTTILSPQASSYRGTEKIAWNHQGVAEDANYSLRHLNQTEILALKLFFQSFETKKVFREVLVELKKQKCNKRRIFL